MTATKDAVLDAALFIRLCRMSAQAWERGNNSGSPEILAAEEKASEGFSNRAEKIAAVYGCSCSWPGLYPVLKRGNREEYGTENRERVARFFAEGSA